MYQLVGGLAVSSEARGWASCLGMISLANCCLKCLESTSPGVCKWVMLQVLGALAMIDDGELVGAVGGIRWRL